VVYWWWLLGVSLCFVLLERIFPARRTQKALRPQIWNDLGYLAFNGHFWAVWTGGVSAGLALSFRSLLPASWFEDAWLGNQHVVIQAVVYLLVSDFLQWNVHRLLHGVPFLWQFHKIHHSAHQMDWAVNFRFHWMELVVYRTLLYLPLALLGGGWQPLFWVAVFATAWGHFNHANVRFRLGPLGYLFNSPSMHLWHHDASDEGGTAKNFGIVFSCWDFLFGTAFWPRERDPGRLGFPSDEEIPTDILRQEIFPVLRRRTP